MSLIRRSWVFQNRAAPVSTRLKNVTPTGIWGWDNRWTLAYHPATWYFDETPEEP